MDFTARPMKVFVFVDREGTKTKMELAYLKGSSQRSIKNQKCQKEE